MTVVTLTDKGIEISDDRRIFGSSLSSTAFELWNVVSILRNVYGVTEFTVRDKRTK